MLKKAAGMNTMRTALAVTALLLTFAPMAPPSCAETSPRPSRQLIEGPSGTVVISRQDRGPSLDHARIVQVLQRHGEAFNCRERFREVAPEIGERVPASVASRRLPARIRNVLPHFEGYAWRRIGDSVVLIAIASNRFHDIFHEILCPEVCTERR